MAASSSSCCCCSCSCSSKFEDVITKAAKATVIIRFTNDPNKHTSFSTGFVIGEVEHHTIIFAIGHCMELGSKEPLEVVFNGYMNEVYGCIIELHLPRSEILIVTVEKRREEIKPGKLIFESAENWKLKFLQQIACVSHPCGRPYRASLGIVNCPEFRNTQISMYDDRMVMFDHSLELGIGSSGAALLNEEGHIVGIQSGQLVSRYLVLMCDALEFKNKQTTDLSLELVGARLAEFVFGYGHLHNVETIVCALKQAVHVMYIDFILRHHIPNEGKEVKLNDLIEKFVSMRIKSRFGSSRQSTHRHSTRSSYPYVRPSSSRTSITFDPPQGSEQYYSSSFGAVEGVDSVYVGGWMNEPGHGGMEPTDASYTKTKSDGLDDTKGKSRIVESGRTNVAAAAHMWNTKERSSGTKAADNTFRTGGQAGDYNKYEEINGSQGGYKACGSSGNSCYMCGEGDHFSRKCSLCLLRKTYEAVASKHYGGWVSAAGEEFSSCEGGYNACGSSEIVCSVCGEADHFARKCSLCLLRRTYVVSPSKQSNKSLYRKLFPDDSGDSKGKSVDVESGKFAAARKWDSKERSGGSKAAGNTYGDGEDAGGGGGAGEWKTIEKFSCSRGGFSSCGTSRNACYMCGEAEHFARNCSLCGLGETYDGAVVGESVGGWFDNDEMMNNPMDALSVSDGLSGSEGKSTFVKPQENFVDLNELMDNSSVSEGLGGLVGKSTIVMSCETVAAAAAHGQDSAVGESVGGCLDNAEMKKPVDTFSVSDGLSDSEGKSTIVESGENFADLNEPIDTSSVSDGLGDLVGKSTIFKSWETVASAAAHRRYSKERSKWKQGCFMQIWRKSRGMRRCWAVEHT